MSGGGEVELGPEIFDRRLGTRRFRLALRNPFRLLYRPRYAKEPLRRAIDALFGQHADTRLTAISTPLAISTVDTGTGAPLILLSGGLAGKRGSDFPLRDALLATSAAPTYFPVHQVAGRSFVDGGLVANAPDIVAVTETIRHFGCNLNDVRVLSIGDWLVRYDTEEEFLSRAGSASDEMEPCSG